MARTIKMCEQCGECSKIHNRGGELKKIMECLEISEAEISCLIKCDRETIHDIIFNDLNITSKFLKRINDYISNFGVMIE